MNSIAIFSIFVVLAVWCLQYGRVKYLGVKLIG